MFLFGGGGGLKAPVDPGTDFFQWDRAVEQDGDPVPVVHMVAGKIPVLARQQIDQQRTVQLHVENVHDLLPAEAEL